MKLNAKGYSLVELMVAVGLISGVALLVSQFSTSYDSSSTNYRRVCESYTESITSLVKEETPYLQIQPFVSRTSNRLPPANVFDDTKALASGNYRAGSADAYRVGRPASEVGAPAASGVRLQSFQLIQGSVRTLAEMYNGGLRCNYAPYNRLGTNLPVPAIFTKLPGAGNVDVDFRIEPYRLSTGASLCAQNQVYPAPQGNISADANGYQTNSGRSDVTANYRNEHRDNAELSPSVINPHDSSRDSLPGSTIVSRNAGPPIVGDPDLGLRFSVRMQYTVDGQQYNCVTTQDFTYPPDADGPPLPNRARSLLGANNSVDDANTVKVWHHYNIPGGRVDGTGAATLELGYDNRPRENGVQLLCKDLSFIKRRPTPTAANTRACFNVPDSPTPILGHPHSPTHGLNTALDRTNVQILNYTADTSLRNRTWVPCESMQQCGESPSSTGLNTTGNGGNDFIWTLNYTTLPFGCHLDFEVIGVDTAGNRSSIASPVFLNKAASGFRPVPRITALPQPPDGNYSDDHNMRGTEIYYPVCGRRNSGYYRPGYGTFCARPTPLGDWATPVPGVAPSGWHNVGTVANGYYTTALRCCGGSAACRPWPTAANP